MLAKAFKAYTKALKNSQDLIMHTAGYLKIFLGLDVFSNAGLIHQIKDPITLEIYCRAIIYNLKNHLEIINSF